MKQKNEQEKSLFKKVLDFKILQVVLGKDIDRFTTLGQFKILKAVNQICLIGLFVYLLLFLGLIISEIKYSEPEVQWVWLKGVIEFIPSIAELTSVFLGIVLGFYWEKADRIKSQNWNRLRARRIIKKELENNIKMIEEEEEKYKSLKSTSWEFYKENMGDFEDETHSNLLTNIYWNICKYNTRIKDETIKLNLEKKERAYINGIIKEIKKDFKKWNENLSTVYKEYNKEF